MVSSKERNDNDDLGNSENNNSNEEQNSNSKKEESVSLLRALAFCSFYPTLHIGPLATFETYLDGVRYF